MDCKVYKSLDRPSVIFGVRGGYIYVVFLTFGVGVFLGVVAAALFSMAWLFVFMLLSLAGGIALALVLQSRMTEREARRRLAMLSLRRYWFVPPGKIVLEDAGKGVKE